MLRVFKLHLAGSIVPDYDRSNAGMTQEDAGELRGCRWAEPSGRRSGSEPWQLIKRTPPRECCWYPPVVSDVLQEVIAQALERIRALEAAAVVDTCTILKAVVRLSPHTEILSLMDQGHLVAVTVPCLAEELEHHLGRTFVGEGEIDEAQRVLAKTVMRNAVVIGTKHDQFRDARSALPLRGITDRNDRAAVAAAWRARTLEIPLVTDDRPLRGEAVELLAPYGVAVMRTESFLDYLDARRRS